MSPVKEIIRKLDKKWASKASNINLIKIVAAFLVVCKTQERLN